MFGVTDPEVAAAVSTYVKLLRASHAVMASAEQLLLSHGLTMTQLGVLEVILHKGPLSHRELGRKVLTSAANMTDVIDKLAARGLVRRVRCPQDRRLVKVELTESGTALIELIFPAHASDIARLMSGLSACEMAELGLLLRKLGKHAEQATLSPSCAVAADEKY